MNGKGETKAGPVRLDKWLWAARFFKTRARAVLAIDAGHVLVNGERVKPAREIRIDERVRIRIANQVWEVCVRGLSDVRGSASVAQSLFLETEASVLERARQAEARRLYGEPASEIKGRPTKRDRRALERLRSG